jgi:hypothetical protein
MNSQLVAAVISASAAVVVALVGIVGAFAVQTVAARRALENFLALSAQQAAVQERERGEQSRREDACRFANQRRATCARFLQLADETRRASATVGAYLGIADRREDDQGWEERGGDPVKQGLARHSLEASPSESRRRHAQPGDLESKRTLSGCEETHGDYS